MTWDPLDLAVQGRDAWKNGVAAVFDYERLYISKNCQKFLVCLNSLFLLRIDWIDFLFDQGKLRLDLNAVLGIDSFIIVMNCWCHNVQERLMLSPENSKPQLVFSIWLEARVQSA